MKKIPLKEFQKLDLRAGTVIVAEKIKDSPKLLRLEVDLGEEKRQIIAGIGKQYQPEKLIGQQIVILANLETKVIFGLESQGMLVAVDDETIALLRP
ncbi:methionine--tRNA ligase, partial [Candidatus Shapirobacteria bacterium CG09_land_8_20_14_0_10_38_17]